MSVLAVIPARGGSKGIKNKNLVEIAGKSLLEWTVDAVRAAKTVDHLFVSTDSIDILRFVEGVLDVEPLVEGVLDVEPLIRPPHLATDHASSEDVVLHALDRTREWGFLADVTVMLQCTSPLTLPEDIDGTVEALLAPAGMTGGVEYSSALSVTPFEKFLWWDMGTKKGVVGIQHDQTQRREMRQERHGQFMENGAVYAMKTEAFLDSGSRFCGYTNTYVMPKERSIEVDDPHDLVIAEALLNARLSVPA